MKDNRDFDIVIKRDADESEHAHSRIELFYVISGDCVFTCKDQVFSLKQRDMILVNAMEAHSYRSKGILCVLGIDYRTLLKFAPEEGCVFSLNTALGSRDVHEEIRSRIHELIRQETSGKPGRLCRIYYGFYALMDTLFMRCSDEPAKDAKAVHLIPDDRKLQQIIAYVHGHYQDGISLTQLAKEMYVSTSTLSRFFRKQTGIYFADYVSQVRLSYAVSDLRGSDKSITRIAADCGFSNSSSFSSLFHQAYGMSPNVYRRKICEQPPEERTADEEKLREEIARQFEQERSREGSMSVCVDVKKSERCHQPFARVVTIGSMSALTRANVQYHLLYAARELHITHARIWSLFTEDMRVTDGKTIGVYNYTSIDAVLDMLVENHIGAYFDFGKRPDVAVRTQDSTVFLEENAVSFASRRAWEALLEDFVQHLVIRYGIDEVQNWYFDFNQDPSYKGRTAYSDDPAHRFIDIWKHACRTIRHYVPGARIGGPVGPPNGPAQEIRTFLREAVRENCVPDFLSIILFPYQPADDYQRFTRDLEPGFEERMIRKVEDILEEMGLSQLPIHISDWNLTLSNRNLINDSCQRGSFFASKAGLMMQHTRICCFWVLSDWVSSYYDSRNLLNGGGGLLTRDSIRKPAWFALQFMGRLGQSVLYASPQLVVTAHGYNDYMILAVNSVLFDVSYYICKEDEIRAEDVDLFVMEGEKLTIQLLLKGLMEADEFIIKSRSVSRQHGSVLDEWKRLRCETQLERADIKYLQEICVPHMTMERAAAKNGQLELSISLEPQEFRLLHIYRGR